MIWVDYFILGVLALSALVGIFRGFTRELFSVIAWVFAFWLAIVFADALAVELERYVATPSIRITLAYGLLFLGGLIFGALVTHLVTLLVKGSPFEGPDRTLGAAFGLVRGGVIVVVLVFLASMTPMRQDPWWDQSFMISPFERAAEQLRVYVPQEWMHALQPPAPMATPLALPPAPPPPGAT